MTSSTSLCRISVSFLLLTIISSFSSATYARNIIGLRSSSTAYLPKLTAEKLTRALNLLPKKSIIRRSANDTLFVPGKIVEKKFTFPNLGVCGPSVGEFAHHAGYYSLPHSKAARMFYLFFESRNSKDDPVVIWLTGGPGCSSQLALFYENGPFQITDNFTLAWNHYGWDKASNILFVDQPIGTGFSYTSNAADIRHDENGVSNDLFDFLQAFFKEHAQFAKNEFYITGESYAGHYIPALASQIHQGNRAKQRLHINLKGFAIGNGLTNPGIQVTSYADYALSMGLVKKTDYEYITQNLLPPCLEAVKSCGPEGGEACGTSLDLCYRIFNRVLDVAGDNINYYDIRKKCEGELCYDYSKVVTLLNEEAVRKALGVGNLEFVACSNTVEDAMLNDWMRNLELGIPALLEDGIRVLVYAGEYDFICNWLGNSRWVHAMKWSGQQHFGASPTVPFVVDGAKAGFMKSHGPLTFLKVKDAGHMVPMDQPKVALEMLRRWMQGN